MKKLEPFRLEPFALRSGPIRTIFLRLRQEREWYLQEVGRVRDAENPQKDAILTAALRGKIQLLDQWIERLSSPILEAE